MAVVPENDTVALSWLWRVNLRWIQKFINTGTIEYCGTEYPTRVFLGGDSPWLCHVLGVTTHWMVASLYSFRILDNGSLEGAEVPRSAQANALWYDQVRSGKMLPVQGCGCTHKLLLQVPNPYFQVLMCILHAVMCIGRIVANEVHSVCVWSRTLLLLLRWPRFYGTTRRAPHQKEKHSLTGRNPGTYWML